MQLIRDIASLDRFKSDDLVISEDEWIKNDLERELKRKGYLNEEDGYNCEECNNRGYIPVILDGNIVYRYCKCRKIRKSIKLLKESGLGDSIKTIAEYEAVEKWQLDIKSKAISFLKQDIARCFYIGGQTGAGKTHICSGIANEYIFKGVPTMYVMWVSMIERLKNFKDESRNEYGRQICDIDVLYIDDFFKPDSTKAEYSRTDIIKTFEIIDRRYKQPGKITLISSELKINELAAVDEATAGRIIEMAGIYGIDIERDNGKNYRLRKNK